MLIRENFPLAPLTTLGVGGPARYFAEARSESEVIEALTFSQDRQLPLFIVGAAATSSSPTPASPGWC